MNYEFLALAGLRNRYASADQHGLLCVAPTSRGHAKSPLVARLYFFYKFTIWNNKTLDWIICKEYLGIGDGFALNLFRLCLDIKTGFSHKNPSAQASQRGGRAGSPNEGACPQVRAKQKTSIPNPK